MKVRIVEFTTIITLHTMNGKATLCDHIMIEITYNGRGIRFKE
jgi:hypothetical protein